MSIKRTWWELNIYLCGYIAVFYLMNGAWGSVASNNHTTTRVNQTIHYSLRISLSHPLFSSFLPFPHIPYFPFQFPCPFSFVFLAFSLTFFFLTVYYPLSIASLRKNTIIVKIFNNQSEVHFNKSLKSYNQLL